MSTKPAFLELGAARIELRGTAVAESLTLRLHGPKVVIVGEPVAVFAPLFGVGSVSRGWFKVLDQDLPVVRPRLGLAPLDPPLPEFWSPIEYVAWGGRLAGLEREQAVENAVRACQAVGLGDALRTPLGKLPVVPRRLTVLAQAICAGPELLVVDMPLFKLDQNQSAFILSALGRITQEGFCSRVIVSTAQFDAGSPADALARGADELVLLLEGQVHEQGSPAELLQKAEQTDEPASQKNEPISQQTTSQGDSGENRADVKEKQAEEKNSEINPQGHSQGDSESTADSNTTESNTAENAESKAHGGLAWLNQNRVGWTNLALQR